MKLNLLKNSGLPVLRTFRHYFLEQLIKYYAKNSKKLGEEKCKDLANAIIDEISDSLTNTRALSVETLKLFFSEVYSDGKFFQNIDRKHFNPFFSTLCILMNYHECEELEHTISSIREYELTKLKERFEEGIETKPDDFELEKIAMLLEQSGYFFTNEDKSIELIDYILREKYQIDLRKGKNLGKIPHCAYNGAMNFLTLYHSDILEERANPEQVAYYFDIIKARIDYLSKSHPNEPDKILIEEPFILELYNMSHSTIVTKGEEVQNGEINKKINEILSLLPKPQTIDPEEEQEFQDCCRDYVSSLMSEETLKKFVKTFLKKLYSAVINESFEDKTLIEGCDILLGQFGLNNPAVLDKKKEKFRVGKMRNIVTMSFWCYANSIIQSLPGKTKRITMLEMKNEPITQGSYTSSPYCFYFNPLITDQEKLLILISSIHHEKKHALDDVNIENNNYLGEVDYLGGKLTRIYDDISSLLDESEYNYYHAPHELRAWDVGYKALYEFANRHKIPRMEDIQTLIDKNSELIGVSDLLLNPAHLSKKRGRTILKKQVETAISKSPTMKNGKLIFDRYIGKKSNGEQTKKDEEVLQRESEILSPFDGSVADIDVLFDRYIKIHTELCAEGSYFSIEYYPDGRRKELKQILADLEKVPEGEDYEGKRKVYKHIIEDRIIPDGNPVKNLKTLMRYKTENVENSILIEEIVEENIDKLLSKLRVYFLREGDPGEKMNVILQKIAQLCSEKSWKEQSPFVRGVVLRGTIKSKIYSPPCLFGVQDIGKKCFGKIISQKRRAAEEKSHRE